MILIFVNILIPLSSMNLKQVAGKKLLLTSSNENEVFNNYHQLTFDDNTIEFKFNMLEGLEDFEQKASPELFFNIIKKLPAIKKGLITYKNEDGLKVYVKEMQRYFLIFSIGEYQYGLYKIYLESVIEKVVT